MLTVLDTVVSLAEFCGTGAHTMWGMGVTRTDKGKVL
jgi:CRISPR/Cas system endoribonuclease Cas6 (RAMP superfamily)